jgi:hypothetical protein
LDKLLRHRNAETDDQLRVASHSIYKFYWLLLKRVGFDCVETWKTELSVTAISTVLALLISYRRDPNAWDSFKVAMLAIFGTLGWFSVKHAVRAPWQLHTRPQERIGRSFHGVIGALAIAGVFGGGWWISRQSAPEPTPTVKVGPGRGSQPIIEQPKQAPPSENPPEVKVPPKAVSKKNQGPAANPKSARGVDNREGRAKPILPIQINSAPDGIAIGGGTVNNPTVNNFGKPDLPPRRLPANVQAEMARVLSGVPGTISISVLMNNREAWDLASDYHSVFVAANWTIDENRIKSFMSVGQPWTGSKLQLTVTGIKPGQKIDVPAGPAATVLAVLTDASKQLNFEHASEATPDGKDGTLTLLIGPRN